MKSRAEYRFESNPTEKVFHDKFKEMFERNGSGSKTLSAIVHGWLDGKQNQPLKWLTDEEEDNCLSLIQWLGSPVGINFLRDCGFKQMKQ